MELEDNLKKQGIPSVTVDIAHAFKARTFVLLLSPTTRNNPKLVEATYKTAGIISFLNNYCYYLLICFLKPVINQYLILD